jgi:hypothetical protein
MNFNVNAPQTYSTNPADYLQRPQGGASPDVLKDVLQLLGEMLQQMQGQGGAGGAGGMLGRAGATPGGPAAMPGGMGATPGGPAAMAGGMGATPGGPAAMAGGGGGTPPMTAQNASGVLASYMGQKNIDAQDPNALYQLAENGDGNTPPTVQQAAQFMLQNPDIYKQIETHDVAGADGTSGVGNFQWAAQGGLGAAGNVPAGAGGMPGGTGALPGGTGAMPSGTGAMPGGTGGLPTTGGLPNTTGAQRPMSGDLVKDGQPLLQGNESKALSNFNTQDSADFEAFEKNLSKGDSTDAAQDLTKAVQSGKLSKEDGAALGAQLESTAKQHGGGDVNPFAAMMLDHAVGSNVVGNDSQMAKLGIVFTK